MKTELEFGVLGFVQGEKLENPEKNPRSKDENQQQTQPTCDTRSANRTRAKARSLGGERLCEKKLFYSRTQYNDPAC